MRKTFLGGAALLTLAALMLVAAGCGGGGGKKGYALTKAEYTSALNKICADFDATQEEIGDPQSFEEIPDKGSRILDEFDVALAEAEKLTPPDELKDTVDQFIAKSKESRDTLRDLVEAAKDGDEEKVNELGTKASELDDESDALATEIGAADCADE